ncbi:hypothetical protein Asch01_01822 [Acinetobacter schindleri]
MVDYREIIQEVFSKYISEVNGGKSNIDLSLNFEDLNVDSMKLIEFIIELQEKLNIDIMSLAMTKNKINNLNDILNILNEIDQVV